MNRYKFIVSKPAEASAKEIAAAKEVSSVADMLKISKTIGEYVFSADAELTKVFRTANSVELTVETLPNGNDINRAVVILPNAAKYRVRVFGTKELQPAKSYTKEEITKLDFGFCTSDGAKVTENRLDAETGEIVKVPVFYVKIA